MLERDLQRKCIKWAHAQGVFGRKVETPGHAGFPDCMFIYEGRLLLVEFKSPKGTGRLSKLQERTHDVLGQYSTDVAVIDSIDAFKCLIKGFINEA